VILYRANSPWSDLPIDGYLAGKKVITKSYSGQGIDQEFELRAEDSALLAGGADATRVVFRVRDGFCAVCPFASGAIAFERRKPSLRPGIPAEAGRRCMLH
jgi:beta-galactosidase